MCGLYYTDGQIQLPGTEESGKHRLLARQSSETCIHGLGTMSVLGYILGTPRMPLKHGLSIQGLQEESVHGFLLGGLSSLKDYS